MQDYSRRSFFKTTIMGTVGFSLLPFLQSFKGSNDTLRIGFIGLGQQTINLMNGFSNIQRVQIVAGAEIGSASWREIV